MSTFNFFFPLSCYSTRKILSKKKNTKKRESQGKADRKWKPTHEAKCSGYLSHEWRRRDYRCRSDRRRKPSTERPFQRMARLQTFAAIPYSSTPDWQIVVASSRRDQSSQQKKVVTSLQIASSLLIGLTKTRISFGHHQPLLRLVFVTSFHLSPVYTYQRLHHYFLFSFVLIGSRSFCFSTEHEVNRVWTLCSRGTTKKCFTFGKFSPPHSSTRLTSPFPQATIEHDVGTSALRVIMDAALRTRWKFEKRNRRSTSPEVVTTSTLLSSNIVWNVNYSHTNQQHTIETRRRKK